MRRLIISGAAAFALWGGAAAPVLATTAASTAHLNSCGYDVNGANVRLRSGPNTGAASLGLLNRGDQVTVDRETRDWCHVELDARSKSGIKAGTAGWVSKRYMKPSVCMQVD
ncbi:SH3 domain-containing protein [Streptomyces sp. NPDC050600]|uniref:SH3 domain-containing protein n=1 Tax=Streptomyces sp. NPDC050600 TaxID=3157213 RepID=UPI00341954C3